MNKYNKCRGYDNVEYGNVNIKIDVDVKKSLEKACAEMGLSMRTAFNVFARTVGVNEGFRLRLLLIHSV